MAAKSAKKTSKTVKVKTTRKASSKAKSKSPGVVVSSSSRLYKSRKDRFVAGVIGGIASYIKVDATILRLFFVAIVAFTGFVPGIFAYAAAAIILPEE